MDTIEVRSRKQLKETGNRLFQEYGNVAVQMEIHSAGGCCTRSSTALGLVQQSDDPQLYDGAWPHPTYVRPVFS